MASRGVPAVQAGRGKGSVKLLLLLSDNFMRPRTRRHWDGLEDMLAHGVHADPYIGLFVSLLEDARFTATAVDVAALYAESGPMGVVPALVHAAGDAAPDYVILNIGNQPFCLSRANLAGLKARWPTTCFILLTTDEAIDFRKVTWCYAEFTDLVLSLDGWIGWGTRYRERWCFMHLVSSELYRGSGAPEAKPVAVGMFGRPKSGRHELIADLRAAGIEVDSNIEDETSWRRLDDSEYVERMRRTRFALVPLRIQGRDEFHLIGRLYEAVLAGAVPVVEDCDLLRPYEPVCGRFLTYRTAEDVRRIVADPAAAAAWSEAASATGLQQKVQALGREAFFDMLAARIPAGEIRRRLGAEGLAQAVGAITPQRPLRLGRLYRERVSWFCKALRRLRSRDAVAELVAIFGLLRAYFTYR